MKLLAILVRQQHLWCLMSKVSKWPWLKITILKPLAVNIKKRIQRQLSDLGVTQIVLGNIGQRSLARLLNAGFAVYQVPNRSELSDVLNEQVAKVPLLAPEQGRPCKREKGECGCGCGSKKRDCTKSRYGYATTRCNPWAKNIRRI